MKNHGTQYRPASRRVLGFTAIEVTAVATIIAILALILIPIMRGRVDDAKVVAAQEDLMAIEKAEMLANADAGKYFRLQDLTRPAPDKDIIGNQGHPNFATEILKVPQAFWNRQALGNEVSMLTRTWKGAQLAIHNSITIQQLVAQNRVMVTLDGNTAEGPILVLQEDQDDWIGPNGGWGRAQYPIDPWGNPYIFLGPGRVESPQGIKGLKPGFVNETDFGTAVVYSLGPDGLPGLADPTEPLAYYRGTGGIGAGDDLVREF